MSDASRELLLTYFSLPPSALQGCFVSLGRGVDARVLLSNLSDTFVPAPAAAFPAVRTRPPSFARAKPPSSF
jgi:hypothetical protein